MQGLKNSKSIDTYFLYVLKLNDTKQMEREVCKMIRVSNVSVNRINFSYPPYSVQSL